MQLPRDIDPEYFDKTYRLQATHWQAAVTEICTRHALPPGRFEAFTDGSNLVAAVGGTVVKIFPPFHRHQWESEYRVLQQLNGRLNFPIPELLAHGERPDGWTYVVLSQLPGVSLETVWPHTTFAEKGAMLEFTGRMMAEVHSIPIGPLATLPPAWPDFIAAQISGFHQRHTQLGMPAWFMAGVEAFVQENLPLLPPEADPVLLTGEYTPFNLLAGKGAGGTWQISGMIDFGDAMTGYRTYDLLGPSLFLCAGDAELVRRLFYGYGYTATQLTPALRRRLMLLMILHRYSNFNLQLRIAGWQERANSVETLGALIWPF